MIGRVLVALVALLVHSAAFAEPFTYQGELGENGSPASGMFDMEFTLRAIDTAVVGGPIVRVVGVSDGLFSVDLEFGDGVFEGGARLLQIRVRPEGGMGAYTELLPWVEIHAAPQAQYSLSTRGIFVSSDGDVGIGTQTLDSKFAVYQNGGGGGGLFEIDHSVNEEAAISVRTNGIGNAGLFQVLNSVNTNAAVRGQTTGAGHAGWFEVMNPGNDAPVLYAGGSGTGPAALIDGDLHVSDDIRQDFGGTFIRTTPIAYATVNFNGSILSGTPNIMVSRDAFEGWYEISVSGETLNTTNYTTLVLPITEGSTPIVPSIKANESGELLLTLIALEVDFFNYPDFQDVFGKFQIVIFKGE